MVSLCLIAAGIAPAPASGMSSHTTPTDAGGRRTAGVSGEVASDVAARSESPASRISVAPESASRTSSALRVTGAGIALVSSNS